MTNSQQELDLKFIKALKDQDLKEAQKWLDAGADVEGEDLFGHRALDLAVVFNNVAMLEFLITAKINVNRPDLDGNTALMHAAVHNKWRLVKLLLKAGADYAYQNPKGASAEGWATFARNSNLGEESLTLLISERLFRSFDARTVTFPELINDEGKLTLLGRRLTEEPQSFHEVFTTVNSLSYVEKKRFFLAGKHNISPQDKEAIMKLLYSIRFGELPSGKNREE